MKTLKNCFAGLYQLLQDPAGWIVLLSLLLVFILSILHRVSDIAVAAVFPILPMVIGLMKHKSFTGSDIDNPPNMPPRGQ